VGPKEKRFTFHVKMTGKHTRGYEEKRQIKKLEGKSKNTQGKGS